MKINEPYGDALLSPEQRKDIIQAANVAVSVSQAKSVAKGVNVTKLLELAHENGQVKTTTPAARACWLYLLKKNYVVAGLMLYACDYSWAGGFQFEAEGGWTTIRYTELDPANPLDEDFYSQVEEIGEDDPDGPDCDQETEEAIRHAAHEVACDAREIESERLFYAGKEEP